MIWSRVWLLKGHCHKIFDPFFGIKNSCQTPYDKVKAVCELHMSTYEVENYVDTVSAYLLTTQIRLRQ